MSYADKIKSQLKNKLETQKDIAESYAGMIGELDNMTNSEIFSVNSEIVDRWSRGGLHRVKNMAWKILDKRCPWVEVKP